MRCLFLKPRNDTPGVPEALPWKCRGRAEAHFRWWSPGCAAAFALVCVLEFAEVNHAGGVSCAPCSRESIGWSRVLSSIEEVRKHREVRSVPSGLRRELWCYPEKSCTHQGKRGLQEKRTAGCPFQSVRPMGPRTIQLGKSCLIPFLLCSWAQSSQQLLGAEEVKEQRA